LRLLDGEGERFGIDGGEPRPRPRQPDAGDHRNARVRRQEDLVRRPDARRFESDGDRVGPARAGDDVGDVEIAGEVSLERLDLLAENEPAAGEDPRDRGIDLRPPASVVEVERSERDPYGRRRGRRRQGTAVSATMPSGSIS
jgi:hypothetical protein